MGCASSAASGGGDNKGDKGVASKQRRKLSVAPGHVGDISMDAAGEGIKDEPENYNLSELEQQSKSNLVKSHAILSRKGYVPYSKKKVNQDRPVLKYALGDKADIALFGVMDGHGEFGHEVSEFVKQKLPVYLGGNIENVVKDPHTGIKNSVKDMCKELASSKINCSFSGTTCVFGVKIGDQMHVANIGDSRCVMCQKNGDEVTAKDLSEDHKPESPDEKKRIEASGGRVETLPGPPGEDCGPFRVWLAEMDVPGLAMSRSIGDEISQTVGVISVPEIRDHTVTDKDMFCVYASDGVWEFISSQEAIALVWKHRADLNNAAKELVEEATKRWKDEEEVIDDITCTIIQFNPFE